MIRSRIRCVSGSAVDGTAAVLLAMPRVFEDEMNCKLRACVKSPQSKRCSPGRLLLLEVCIVLPSGGAISMSDVNTKYESCLDDQITSASVSCEVCGLSVSQLNIDYFRVLELCCYAGLEKSAICEGAWRLVPVFDNFDRLLVKRSVAQYTGRRTTRKGNC